MRMKIQTSKGVTQKAEITEITFEITVEIT